MRIAKAILVFSATIAATFAAPAFAAERIITIGTAGVTGVYYPAGGAICRLVNRDRKKTGIRCVVESTGGSISNLEGIHSGDLDLGIVQSDLLYHATTGTDIFSDAGSDRNVRILMRLHAEPFTVVARKGAHIAVFDDLKGKRVYMGAPGSGPRATMEEVMKRKGWTSGTFTSVDIPAADQAKALCSGRIDALIYTGGHPNGTIQQVTARCATRLVSVTGPAIDKLIAEHPFYYHAVIPGGMYAGNPKPVHTFGVEAILVASKNLDDAIAYEVVRAVFENLDHFKTLHPVFATLDMHHMIPAGDIAPIHPGALKYYREKGLIK
ncbi:MAG: TAXI family TRAP transporter solute-binding subunit [Pseudomonadota bacterium]|nr:TAXI family TRAP transporter solute-binding subunit [Pseudomonadota bacterium]MDE3037237.1 TAXI family TRAP transporter solute-binding subunit [Pseudomonadota bacterium]